MRPTLSEMRVEIKIRNSNSRPDYFPISKCMETLSKAPCAGEDVFTLFNEVAPDVKKTKHRKNRDAPRLVNAIMEFQE